MFTSSATFSLAENSATVGTVTATDPDAADSVTGYTLSGTDAALFEITTAGALSFSSAPNYEAPAGGVDDDSNTYELTVTATGGADSRALTTTQDLEVSVTDAINDVPGAPRSLRLESYPYDWQDLFDWSAPAHNGGAPILEYEFGGVHRNSEGVSTHTISGTTTGSVTQAVIGDPPATVEVRIRVRARNINGWGPWASAVLED